MRFAADVFGDPDPEYRKNVRPLLASASVDYDRGDLIRLGAIDDETDELLEPFASVGFADGSSSAEVPTVDPVVDPDDEIERADLIALLVEADAWPDDLDQETATLEEVRDLVEARTVETGGADEKAAVIAALEAAGAEYDGRWGVERLKAALEAHQAGPGTD